MYFIFYYFLILLLCFKEYFSGTLTPIDIDPIQQSISNTGHYSRYTFKFIPDTNIPVGGKIEIFFPSQFESQLGITSITTDTCNFECTVIDRRVTFEVDEILLKKVEQTVYINDIKNPTITASQGTSNFGIRTFHESNMLDENLIFGSVGISTEITELISTVVSIDSSGTTEAGESSKLSFSFKTTQLIPSNSYFLFKIDPNSGFTISSNPSCESYKINNQIISGVITCTSDGTDIIVKGLTQDIQTNFDVGISVAVTNPPYSQKTGNFAIYIFRDGTNMIYSKKTDISPIQITPGELSSVLLKAKKAKILKSKGKIMDYYLQFVTKNKLQDGAVITVTFPSNFKLLDPTTEKGYVYCVSGIEDKSPSDPAIIE